MYMANIRREPDRVRPPHRGVMLRGLKDRKKLKSVLDEVTIKFNVSVLTFNFYKYGKLIINYTKIAFKITRY